MKKLFVSLIILFTSNTFGQNITLRDTLNQFDYIIITVPEFEETCSDFKQHKEIYNNFSVLITTKEKILIEFSDSVGVEENIRDFISYSATFWQQPTPAYFLFAGDISKIPNFEFESVPGYTGTDTAKSDYYYGINKHASNDNETLYIGRIAVRNDLELSNYFNKVITYDNSDVILPWQNNALLVADDGITPTHNDGDIFERRILEIAENFPDYISSKMIFENDTSVYFGNTDTIINYINGVGTSSLYFCGHGYHTVFTHDSLFTINDVYLLQNPGKPFFFSSLFPQQFSDNLNSSLIDQMMFSSNGALVGFAPVGIVYVTANFNFTKEIFQNLYTDQSIGKIAAIAFNLSGPLQKNLYNIFGDPSLVFKYDLIASTEDNDLPYPKVFELYQNYPNPFNPITTINFLIPETGRVTLEVFDIIGNQIEKLADGNLKSGTHSIKYDASSISSGVYFYRLNYNSKVIAKKMIVLK